MENVVKKTDEEQPGAAAWEPKIMAFVCNWCTYAGADLAGTSRMEYRPNVRIVIIKAFENGADGVLVSGCHPGDCHYTAGNYHARRRWIGFKSLMEFVGLDMKRLHFSWVSASEAIKWVDLINSITDEIKKLGPFMQYRGLK
jgi:coenzyme F420-reducing hydrogenase delta subunit